MDWGKWGNVAAVVGGVVALVGGLITFLVFSCDLHFDSEAEAMHQAIMVEVGVIERRLKREMEVQKAFLARKFAFQQVDSLERWIHFEQEILATPVDPGERTRARRHLDSLHVDLRKHKATLETMSMP